MQNCEKPTDAASSELVAPHSGGLRRVRRALAGVTLIETIVSTVIILIGLAGLYTTAGQSYVLLRRAKELVAAREDILSRLDSLRVISYNELAQYSYVSANVMQTGGAGDATPFGMTTVGMKNFKETLTVYGLGWQVFSNDAARNNATPDFGPNATTQAPGEFASEINAIAPAAPATYMSNSTTQGDWTVQVANALPYYTITRTGTGSGAVVTVTNWSSTSQNVPTLPNCPQLRVDITYSWSDSNGVSRSQVGSMIFTKMSSLP